MTRTGRSGKLTTGNINRGILPRLIFCFRVGGQAIFLEPEGRDGCDCRVMSRSDADGAGPLSRPFLRTLGMDRRVHHVFQDDGPYVSGLGLSEMRRRPRGQFHIQELSEQGRRVLQSGRQVAAWGATVAGLRR